MQPWRHARPSAEVLATRCLVCLETGHDTVQHPGPASGKADLLKTGHDTRHHSGPISGKADLLKTGHDTRHHPGPASGKADLLKTVAMSAASSLLRPNLAASNPRSWALDSVRNALRFFSELCRPWLELPASACTTSRDMRQHVQSAARVPAGRMELTLEIKCKLQRTLHGTTCSLDTYSVIALQPQ